MNYITTMYDTCPILLKKRNEIKGMVKRSVRTIQKNKSATAYTTTSLQQAIDGGLPLPPITGATYSYIFSKIQSP
jgi:hypothetical protein